MISIPNYIDVPEFGRTLFGYMLIPVVALLLIRSFVGSLESERIIKARIWIETQFRSCFVLPDVKPLGRKGRLFCSWGVRIVSDLVGSANYIIGASILLSIFGASGQMSVKLYFGLFILALFYFLLGCGLIVQGRKEQKRIRGDN